MDGMIIKKVDKTEIPFELLQLADPSKECIEDYISRGEVFGAYVDNSLAGVCVLIKTRSLTAEIVNIAVYGKFQGKGIGKKLIMFAIQRAKAFGSKVLEIGTGNSSIYQLALYQKCGFRITGIDRDFFKRHGEYIVENGIECTDMIRLSLEL